MPEYRRWRQAGGTFFFTVTLQERTESRLIDQIELLRSCVSEVRDKRAFEIDAAVVLPDHLHMIWTLPRGDDDFSTRWQMIKTAFSRQQRDLRYQSFSKQRKGERGIWQRRFWEHLIRDETDLYRHIEYIHYNPVKHGLVERPSDWPHSSIHQFIRKGVISSDWSAGPDVRELKLE